MSPSFPVIPPPVPRWAKTGEEMRLARIATEAPRVPWDVFMRRDFIWNPGEHVALLGPTGQGKTTLLSHILTKRKFVTVFATKPEDESMEWFVRHGYYPLRRWQSLDPKDYPKRVLWPDASQLDSRDEQRRAFKHAFEKIYREKRWTVAIDELWYFSNILRLDTEIRLYLLQARSLDISLVAATQRPAWVPVEVYDQSTHMFFWRDNDEPNLKRISGTAFQSAELVRFIVANLERHQVLYHNTRTGQMLRTRAPKLAE